ncbi:MAG: hypothetical protein HY606_04805 [Planctomycetes bacterium]|nr:hypothetical protein [Planctomycetota bacterium]
MFEDILAGRYPASVQLNNGKKITIRILTKEDENELVAFFKRFPEEEKLFLRNDISDENLVRGWCRNIDLEKIIPLIGFDGNKMIANCTLHQERRGWQSHLGRLRVGVDSHYRGLGVTYAMIKEFANFAPLIGLRILDAEVMREQTRLLDIYQLLGFNQIALHPDHVLDRHGGVHDMVVMSLKVVVDNAEAVD